MSDSTVPPFKVFPTVVLLLSVLLLKKPAVTAISYSYQNAIAQCRCLPGDSCWPSVEQWNSFNTSLGGRLVIPHPTAYPCYGGPGFNAPDCRQIQLFYNAPGFLIGKPGSMWNFNWEELDDQRCSLEGAYLWDTVCQTGRVPSYVVDAHTPEDIQKALSFATQHNLRIVVKTTGHDFLGRSTAPGALMIWLHNFEGNIETYQSFAPVGCGMLDGYNEPVVTVTGGKTWDEVYKQLEKKFDGKYCVVGGYCQDIGAVGGYSLGGGHGTLSPSFGLAVDNILEIMVVTADGKHLASNACQNKDLFWALRGGGGGTFGIAISITYKLHSVPSGFLAYSFLVVTQNSTGNLSVSQVEKIIEVLARRTASLDDVGWSGRFRFFAEFGFSVMLLIPADRLNALPAAEELKDELVALSLASAFLVKPFPNLGTFSKLFGSFEAWRIWSDTVGVYDGLYAGPRFLLGSRLIPITAFTDSHRLSQVLTSGVLKNGFKNGWFGLLVAGNGVRNRDTAHQEMSANPAWRKAGWHVLLSTGWEADATADMINETRKSLNAGVQIMRDAFPDSGAYGNEAFPEEPGWQGAFWGSNYERLLQIKKQVDPKGLFVCSMCVGSEEWDQTGNCRYLVASVTNRVGWCEAVRHRRAELKIIISRARKH